MSEKRRGLGRGLGALIPTGLDGNRSSDKQRPVDVFFPDNVKEARDTAEAAAAAAATITAEASSVSRETASDAAVAALPTTGGESASRAPIATSGSVDAAPAAAVDAGTDVSTDAEVGVPPIADGAQNGTHNQIDGGGANEVHAAVENDSVALTSENAEMSSQDEIEDGGLLPVPGAWFAELPVGSIRPNPRQPRTVFEEDALDELIGSIREIGVLQPIVVRPDGEDGYELIMGERRWRATQAAGLETIPAIVRDTEDSDLLRDALLENLHRAELNPLEEAAAYRQLLDDFGCTHEELAARIHRSRPQISNTLRLLRLPPLVQRRVAAGVLSAGHARALLGLTDGAAIERLAQRIVSEGLSVRAVEEIVSLGGDAAPAARRGPRAGERNEALDDLAARLSDRLDTRVKINLGKSRGRLTVEFASVQDLNRILESLAPEERGLLRH